MAHLLRLQPPPDSHHFGLSLVGIGLLLAQQRQSILRRAKNERSFFRRPGTRRQDKTDRQTGRRRVRVHRRFDYDVSTTTYALYVCCVGHLIFSFLFVTLSAPPRLASYHEATPRLVSSTHGSRFFLSSFEIGFQILRTESHIDNLHQNMRGGLQEKGQLSNCQFYF